MTTAEITIKITQTAANIGLATYQALIIIIPGNNVIPTAARIADQVRDLVTDELTKEFMVDG